MQNHDLYLPMLVPFWGIFLGIALVIVGFADKKSSFTLAGWSVLIIMGLVSLFYNLFQINPANFSDNPTLRETAGFLVTTNWLNVSGALLALASLLFFHFRKKRYVLLAFLTILFYSILFFQYYSLIQKPK